NRVMIGLAELEAVALDTAPSLVAVWDGVPTVARGGTHGMIRAWGDRRLHVIPLPSAPRARRARAPRPRRAAPAGRVVKTLLFADVVGFSKLEEEHTPRFMHGFLATLARRLARFRPALLNTWGDGIFAVMDEATEMADLALTMARAVADTDWTQLGL